MREIRITKMQSSFRPAHTIHAPRGDMHPQIIEASFALAGGLSNPEKHYSEQTLDAADRMKGDASLHQLLMEGAVRNGYRCRPGQGVTAGNLRSVLEAAFAPIQAAGWSTFSIPETLSNVSNKFIQDGWNSVDGTILRIAYIRSVKNFKEIKTVSLVDGLTFDTLAPNGEIKHGTISETTYGNKADTYARMLTVDRHDIINDDLDSLTVVPRKLGRGGMLKLNDIGWTEFLNPSVANFWHSDNANVNTGIADMTLGGLAATELIFMNQTDPSNSPLGVSPKILLVPSALKSAALTLMNSQFTISGTSTDTMPSGNVWQGSFQIESSPYLSITSYTGADPAAWYLLADPRQLAVLEICALNGRVEPIVESATADFNVLGIQMRGYSDVGCRIQEPRGGVRADGGSS